MPCWPRSKKPGRRASEQELDESDFIQSFLYAGLKPALTIGGRENGHFVQLNPAATGW